MNHHPNHANALRSDQSSRAMTETGIEDRDLRIEVFVLCDGALEQNGRLSLLGAYEVLGSPAFPFVFPQMTVALRVRFWPAEAQRHRLRLAMTHPDGRVVGQAVNAEITLHPTNNDRSTAYNLIAQIKDTPIEEPGEYTFDFYLNDKIEGRLPIWVTALPRPHDGR